MKVSTLVESTGEVLSFPAGTPDEIIEAWRIASDYIKAYERLKDKLKASVRPLLDSRGQYEHNGYLFREIAVQPMNYDKAVLRQVFDEDTLDLFLKPSKKDIDNYIKEHLPELGHYSTELRKTMVPAGKPYSTLRLEKVQQEVSNIA